jgi:hypothetical protein
VPDLRASELVLGQAQQVTGARVTYVIDGQRIENTDDFYTVPGEAVNGPGGHFGKDWTR